MPVSIIGRNFEFARILEFNPACRIASANQQIALKLELQKPHDRSESNAINSLKTV